MDLDSGVDPAWWKLGMNVDCGVEINWIVQLRDRGCLEFAGKLQGSEA